MKTLLIVYHSRTGGTRQMAQAVARGAASGGEVTVRVLDAPDAGTIAGQWTLTQLVEGDDFLGSALPPDEIQNYVRGKWKYASNLDAFVGLEGAEDGNIWIYKPMGWTNPVPEPSTWAMFGAGLSLLVLAGRRRRRA